MFKLKRRSNLVVNNFLQWFVTEQSAEGGEEEVPLEAGLKK